MWSRRTTGYVFKLSGGAISWRSKLQHAVTKSSTEAEYYALSDAASMAVYLRSLYTHLAKQTITPTIIYVDNMGAIHTANDPVTHDKAKHIAVHMHFCREQTLKGSIKPTYIPTADQLADPFTKVLPLQAFKRLVTKVMGY